MNEPMFSIIVPIYKVETYLDKCVQSLRGQTYGNIEIILVDDGSPDSCPAMCDAYARADSRIRVIHKKNGGLSDARNAGICAAAGQYLIFVDSDDCIDLRTCEQLLPFAGNDIIIGDGECHGGKTKLRHGHTREVLSGRDYLKLALQRRAMPMAAWLYVYRRDFLLEHSLQFRYGITHEDEEFTPRAFLVAERVVECGFCFYQYFIRPNSITTGADRRKNGTDFYATCLSLRERYLTLEDAELKMLLLDSLVVKYLSLFQTAKLYQYGKEYLHKDFVWKHAKRPKTRCKALLYVLSPRLYWHVNRLTKQGK